MEPSTVLKNECSRRTDIKHATLLNITSYVSKKEFIQFFVFGFLHSSYYMCCKNNS